MCWCIEDPPGAEGLSRATQMCSSTKELGEGHASFLFESNSSGGAYENPPLLVIGCTPSLGRHANIDVKAHKDIHIQVWKIKASDYVATVCCHL